MERALRKSLLLCCFFILAAVIGVTSAKFSDDDRPESLLPDLGQYLYSRTMSNSDGMSRFPLLSRKLKQRQASQSAANELKRGNQNKRPYAHSW